MYYYEVLVTQEYTAKNSVFTYAHPTHIAPFTYVHVPLQKKSAAGIIVKKAAKPDFKTKSITTVYPYVFKDTQKQLLRFLTDYYVATEAQVLQLFLPSFLPKTLDVTTQTYSHDYVQLPDLTQDQYKVLQQLRIHTLETIVLHGDTGSGKTRVYIERTRDTVTAGKSVLILVPEIGLIPQMQAAFAAAGIPTLAYHSSHTPKQRALVWRSTYDGTARVIIGTRSALFLPHANLGLIILDESHEPAYKQEEGIRYHASRVASVLAKHEHAQLVLASATPSVNDVYLAQQRQKPVVRMQQTAVSSSAKRQVHVIDMTDKANFSKHPMLSTHLLQAITDALQKHEQAMVYLNRRGTAKVVLCSDCGWQAMCDICNIGMTYHHDSHNLVCHTCGSKQSVPVACPDCGSQDILYKSAGTKALADWLQNHFKSARVARFDTDNTKAESLAENHQQLQQGDVDILVGTQMLVKGFDLPNLSVVGIVAADLSLSVPDFSAEERTYQLLAQAIGRVGRGHRDGTVYIQTHQPNNLVIQQAIAANYDDFYTTQVAQKKSFDFPPIYHMATAWVNKKSTTAALGAAKELMADLSNKYKNCTFLGPVVTFKPKKRGFVSAQIVVKTTQRSTLAAIAKNLPADWQYDLEPINLL